MTQAIDRLKKSIPLYMQIADSLMGQIESGELHPGDRLPAEREMSENLAVQRETVRQALDVLEKQGLVRRRRGSGTYIAEPKIEREASRLFPFTRYMQRKGYKPGSRVISMEKVCCNQAVAQDLELPLSTPVYHVERLRTVNQEPVVLENFYTPETIFNDLERFDLSERSIYEIMETEYGSRVTQARQSLEAVVATEFEAGLLECEKGDPLMLERRLTFDQFNRRVESAKDLFRGDRFRFITEMTPLES
jgi:GntR family transcriptional regulator